MLHPYHVPVQLYVGSLPSTFTDDQLRAMFEPFTKVNFATVIIDQLTVRVGVDALFSVSCILAPMPIPVLPLTSLQQAHLARCACA